MTVRLTITPTSGHLRLSPDTPLRWHTDRARWQAGQWVMPAVWTYPEVSVAIDQLPENALNHRERYYAPNALPVCAHEGAVYTHPHWAYLVALAESESVSRHQASQRTLEVFNLLRHDRQAQGWGWAIRCPAMAAHETLTGALAAAWGRVELSDGTSDLLEQAPKEGMWGQWLARQAPDAWLAFRDQGRTLLDLALEHQLWVEAEALWQAGVRWSTQALESGRSLDAIAVGWLRAYRQEDPSFVRAVRSAKGAAKTPGRPLLPIAQATQVWLERWLDRWEHEGVPYAPLPCSTYRPQQMQQRSSQTLMHPGQETSVQAWAAWLPPTRTGMLFTPEEPLQLHPEWRQGVDTWFQFWAKHGVDWTTVTVHDTMDEQPLSERWARHADWWAHACAVQHAVQTAQGLEAALPASAQAPAKPRARL